MLGKLDLAFSSFFSLWMNGSSVVVLIVEIALLLPV